MEKFLTLLVGSAMLAGMCVASWLLGLLMGLGISRLMRAPGGKHQDVEDLLARERAAALRVRQGPSAAAPGATTGG